MSSCAPPGPAALVDQVLALAEHVFGTVERLRQATAQAFAQALPDRPARAALATLEPLAEAALSVPDPTVVGAGFVAAPGVLADEPHWLEWWTRAAGVGGGTIEQLSVVTDAAAPTFRDWTTLPWYAVPQRTHARYVTGPYVDYLCTDEYTLTFTVPVLVGQRFVGVAGADVYARTVERRLTAPLRELPEPAALVNAQGRVVAGNAGAPVTGELLRSVPSSWPSSGPSTGPSSGPSTGPLRVFPCADLPLAVVTGFPADALAGA